MDLREDAMGFGGYSYEAHQAITTARSALPTQEVFAQRSCHPLMNPKGVKYRESRDSPDHPNTMSIVFALDVSGSMGAIPEQIARKELPGFMKTLLDCGVADPQVLFMAFQDCAAPEIPLQVGQFESTAELMDQWLTWCWIIGQGASQYESYDLALHFAAHHTKMDCWEKRGKKGYFFMTGDEPCYPALNAAWVKEYVGDALPADVPLAQVVTEISRTFHPFFLVPDPGRFAQCGAFWREQLGANAIALAGPGDASPVAASIVAISERAVTSIGALADRLRTAGYSKERVDGIVGALRDWAMANGAT
jgi:hypothetical protein